jgi:hypothetical protein
MGLALRCNRRRVQNHLAACFLSSLANKKPVRLQQTRPSHLRDLNECRESGYEIAGEGFPFQPHLILLNFSPFLSRARSVPRIISDVHRHRLRV